MADCDWDEGQHKSETLVLNQRKVMCSLWVGGELLLQVEEFKYLGVLFTSEGISECEINNFRESLRSLVTQG